MSIPISPEAADAATVPPVAGFRPDRLGIRRVTLDIDRGSGSVHAGLTPCPATASQWGPRDSAEVVSPDLLAELFAAPDSPRKAAALAAVQRVMADLLTVSALLLILRGGGPAPATGLTHEIVAVRDT